MWSRTPTGTRPGCRCNGASPKSAGEADVGETIVLGLIAGVIYALIAVGITLVYKCSRVLNFAQAEIGTLALYWTWWISGDHQLPWAVGALVSIVFAVAVGLVFERFFIRPIAALLDEPTVGALAPGVFAGLFIGGLTAALVGGLSSLPGAFAGGILVGLIEAEIKAHLVFASLPDLQYLAMLGMVLLVLLVR